MIKDLFQLNHAMSYFTFIDYEPLFWASLDLAVFSGIPRFLPIKPRSALMRPLLLGTRFNYNIHTFSLTTKKQEAMLRVGKIL